MRTTQVSLALGFFTIVAGCNDPGQPGVALWPASEAAVEPSSGPTGERPEQEPETGNAGYRPIALAFSADGARLAHGRIALEHGHYTGELRLMDTDSGHDRFIDDDVVLTDDSVVVRALSADGSTLAYLKRLPDHAGHYRGTLMLWSEGRGTVSIGKALFSTPRLSPDGAQLVFVDLDGRLQHVDTRTLDTQTLGFQVSQAGHRIGESGRIRMVDGGVVFVALNESLHYGAFATGQTRQLSAGIVPHSLRLHDTQPRIAWVELDGDARRLVIEDLPTAARFTSPDGADKAKYSTPSFELSPSWSHAAYVVYGTNSGATGTLAVTHLESGETTEIAPGVRPGGTRWLDSTRLLFLDQPAGYYDGDLHIHDFTTGLSTLIWKDVHAGSTALHRLYFSPDKDRVAFVSGSCGPKELNLVMTATLSPPVSTWVVDTMSFCVWGMRFVPDGSTLLHYQTSGGYSPFHLRHIDQAKGTVSTDRPAFHHFADNGRYSVSDPGYAGTGARSPLIVHDWLKGSHRVIADMAAHVALLSDRHVAWVTLDEPQRLYVSPFEAP